MKVIVAGLLMGTFAVYFSKLNMIILIILAAILYFMLVYLFRVVDKTDIDLVRSLMRKSEHTGDQGV